MNLVKSFLARAAALMLYLLVTGAVVRKLLAPPKLQPIPDSGGGFTWGGAWIPIWPIAIGAVLVFAAAFYWILKRIS
jgi:hypothetical protein